jgi:UDP-glucose 4-epimerase
MTPPLLGERVLVTGGAGYLGSHACLALIERGATVTVLDNLSNGDERALHRVASLTGVSVPLIRGDIRDEETTRDALSALQATAVMHFAGLKAVGESTQDPLRYYDHNVNGAISLLKAMEVTDVRRLIFSSSATVYGAPDRLPIDEHASLKATNPYGRSKLMIEEILRDLADADDRWAIALLRYFNPVGAHPSGLIGEDPKGTPNNLAPYITQVALGVRPVLSIFGDDYETPDGTGVRDYIHVMDLIEGHIAALAHLDREASGQARPFNLGTGRGVSVLELVRAMERASQREIPYQVVDRRSGDVASCYADPSEAHRVLGWRARRTVTEMAEDAWRWQSMNPQGYREAIDEG